MKPRARTGLLAALVALAACAVVAALVAWFLHTHERIEHKQPLPPQGEAAWNPLYALRESLRADKVPAQTRQRLEPALFVSAPGDTVLLDGDPARLRAAEVDALLDWVASGGHLLLRTPLASVPGDDDADGAPEVPPLLLRLGVEALLPPACVQLQVRGEESHVEFCDGWRVQLERGVSPRRAWGDAEPGYAFVRLAHGRGTVDVASDYDIFGNDQLDEATHQALARQLLAPNYGRGTVHLVYATRIESLWWRLLRDGWMLWSPLALLLAGWLWRRAQRFGPWLPSPVASRRSLREHVRASGALLLRRGQAPLLYDATREAFLARLRRRDPASAALAGEARVQAIAARLQLPHYLVREALTRQGVQDRHVFFARVRTLIQMRNRL
ncbi:DUF4350 domain-containing protein [Pseudoxanthomonas daejeonensis]|uniref:DUF4350 domain-containing protein n=1 Tax=Pseudoxanthomonas daejeonensis TaxID=266062 RepID=UPI001F53FD41|nr:DUF4350 domain-containing protein [Pseudoxanthomonas daejeonensis]UNK58934.1 DUF4350 domain-containing protein [Pseudoxanthomonas daejeonensis]